MSRTSCATVATFWEIGDHDEDAHRRMLLSTGSFLREAIPRGVYRGWLAQTGEGRVVAGAGVAIVPWPGSPEDPAGHRGWIQNVYTEPAFRHRGLARRLMQAAIDWCREAGFVHISLHASAAGRPLYEGIGFLSTNEMRLRLR